MIADKESSIGDARAQISGVVSDAQYFFGRYPKGTAYEPREIL